MNDIEKWLTENNISWKRASWGDPHYFNDNFKVFGLLITFDSGSPQVMTKITAFKRYMRRKNSYNCCCCSVGNGYWYRVLTVAAAERLAEHEQRIIDAIDASWQDRRVRKKEEAAAV